MAVIVNNPRPAEQSNNNTLLLLIFFIILLLILIFYGLPAIRNLSGGTQVNVPRQIDINVNNPGNTGGQSGDVPQQPANP